MQSSWRCSHRRRYFVASLLASLCAFGHGHLGLDELFAIRDEHPERLDDAVARYLLRYFKHRALLSTQRGAGPRRFRHDFIEPTNGTVACERLERYRQAGRLLTRRPLSGGHRDNSLPGFVGLFYVEVERSIPHHNLFQ